MTYKDKNGYLRSKSDGKLIHRKVVYKKHKSRGDPRKFSSLVVHHKDGNKLNNNYSNLEPMTQKKHNEVHGRTPENNYGLAVFIIGLLSILFLWLTFETFSIFYGLGDILNGIVLFILGILVFLPRILRKYFPKEKKYLKYSKTLKIISLIIIFGHVLLGIILFYS